MPSPETPSAPPSLRNSHPRAGRATPATTMNPSEISLAIHALIALSRTTHVPVEEIVEALTPTCWTATEADQVRAELNRRE